MSEYHKIVTVWERDPDTKFRTLIDGKWATPEFAYLKDAQWVWTEKVDGMNIRVMWDGANVSFGGKTDAAQIPTTLLNVLRDMLTPDLLNCFLKGPTTLYGEGYGAKIQKGGGLYRKDQGFVLFDVKCGNWWLKREDVALIGQNLKCGFVPTIGSGTLSSMVEVVRNGFESCWGRFPAEGIVARPDVELFCRSGVRVITKLKTKDFSSAKGGA